MTQQTLMYKKICQALKHFGLDPRAWRLIHAPLGPGAALVFEHRECQELKLMGRLDVSEQLRELEWLSI